MRLVALLISLALPALARLSFTDAAKKLPALSLPLTLEPSAELARPLTARDVTALGLDGQELLAPLRPPLGKKEKRALRPVGRVQRGASTLLLLRLEREAPGASARTTLLFTFGAGGELAGAAVLLAEASEPDLTRSGITTLDAAGGITRSVKEVRRQSTPGLPEELVVTFEQRLRVTASGALEVSPTAWTARTGAYVDARTAEELRVSGKRVFYRAKEGDPFVEMVGDGNTLRLGGEPRPWVLTWNDRRSELTAQTPAGDVQRFVRRW